MNDLGTRRRFLRHFRDRAGSTTGGLKRTRLLKCKYTSTGGGATSGASVVSIILFDSRSARALALAV